MPSDNPFVETMHAWLEVFMRRSMQNFMRYSKETGLSMAQIGALFRIHKGSGGVSDLGGEMGVSSAAASQLLERLVQQGLILRREDPQDRRAKQIVLTDKGSQVLAESMHARQGWVDDLDKTLSPSERGQVIAALQILIEKASQLA